MVEREPGVAVDECSLGLLDCVHHEDILLCSYDAKAFKRIQFLQDVDSISNWCTLWQLKLNVSKCISVRFGLVDRPSSDYYMVYHCRK